MQQTEINSKLLFITNMKNLIQYRYSFEEVFFKYLKNQIDIPQLAKKLQAMENDHIVNNRISGGLNLKFGDTDPTITTINELITDLQGSINNREYREEQMQACINLNAGINGTELYIYPNL